MKSLLKKRGCGINDSCPIPDGYLVYIAKIATNDAVFQDEEPESGEVPPHKIEHFLAKVILEMLHKNGSMRNREVKKICDDFQWNEISHNLLRAIWTASVLCQKKHSHLILERIMGLNGLSLDNMEVFACTDIRRKYLIPRAILKTFEIARYCNEVERGDEIGEIFLEQTSFEFWQKRIANFVRENIKNDFLVNFLSLLLQKMEGQEKEILIEIILPLNVLHLCHFEILPQSWLNRNYWLTEALLLKLDEVSKHCNQVEKGRKLATKIENSGFPSWRAQKHQIYGS